MRRAIRRGAALALASLLALGCRGPKPEVESFEVRAGGPGTIVTVILANRTGGEGQVAVEVTLRSGTNVLAREDRMVALYPHERASVVVLMPVPYDRDVTADVQARYPVD